jgi:hypothetical protein
MNSDGSGRTKLAFVDGADPTWSPDGSRIAISSERTEPNETYTINPDGTGETRLTFNATADREPSWQPLRFKNAAKRCKAFPGDYRNHGQCVKATR